MAVSAAVALGAVSVGYQIYSGQKQQKSQREQLRLQEQANIDAKKRAKEAADRADIDMNKANRKKADVSARRTGSISRPCRNNAYWCKWSRYRSIQSWR